MSTRRGAILERRTHHEEGSRAALDGLKNQAVTGELLDGLPVTASRDFFVPRCWNWHTDAACTRVAFACLMGPNPIRGTTFTPNRILVHNTLR